MLSARPRPGKGRDDPPVFSADDERSALYAQLEGARPSKLTAAHFHDERHALVHLAIDVMRDRGLLLHRSNYLDAAKLNAAFLERLLLRAEVWPAADPPRPTLRAILSTWGAWWNADYLAAAVIDAHNRRQIVEVGNRVAHQATQRIPLVDLIEQLKGVLEGAELCLK